MSGIPMRVTLQLIDFYMLGPHRVTDFQEFQIFAFMSTDATFTATTCDLNDRSIKVEQLIK